MGLILFCCLRWRLRRIEVRLAGAVKGGVNEGFGEDLGVAAGESLAFGGVALVADEGLQDRIHAAGVAGLEAVQLHGAYGFSDEYPVERYLRNSKGAVIYEGTSEIHQLMQADYAFGFREDRPLRCELPAYDAEFWQAEAVAG